MGTGRHRAWYRLLARLVAERTIAAASRDREQSRTSAGADRGGICL